MKKVKITPDNINDFYDKVNSLIDSYFDAWAIKPSALKRYLKPGSIGMKKFIERNDLSNIIKIEKIITDVVEDRYGMEKDGIIKFESFTGDNDNDNTSNTIDIIHSFWTHPIFKDVKYSNIEYEKAICDKYRVSLGHVEVIDLNKHIYQINHSEGSFNIFILSDDDIKVIIDNFRKLILDRIYDKTIEMKDVNFKIDLSDILGDRENILDTIEISKDHIKNVISDLLQNDDFDYSGDFKGYYFWEN